MCIDDIVVGSSRLEVPTTPSAAFLSRLFVFFISATPGWTAIDGVCAALNLFTPETASKMIQLLSASSVRLRTVESRRCRPHGGRGSDASWGGRD
jgi:hypothetical protein